eukprot:COSAG05_NODE_497_length_9246_cov_6.935343_2_plen_109_part_00
MYVADHAYQERVFNILICAHSIHGVNRSHLAQIVGRVGRVVFACLRVRGGMAWVGGGYERSTVWLNSEILPRYSPIIFMFRPSVLSRKLPAHRPRHTGHTHAHRHRQR